MSREALEVSGTVFEALIATKLREIFKGSVLIHSKTVKTKLYPPKDSTQIDIIMVHPKGVFVIESKNWKHSISGIESEKDWNGVASNLKRMTIINPVYQNFNHIRLLRNAMRRQGFEPIPFHNIVCVPDSCVISTDSSFVHNLEYMLSIIDSYIKMSPYTINVDEYCKYIRKVV